VQPDGAQPIFATTHWSVVLAARQDSSTLARDALEQLCRAYWYPLYAFVRRQGHGPEEAEDLTQEFFARLIEKEYLRHLTHREGRFRSFLLKFLQHFLANERHRVRARKRGGGQAPQSLDGMTPEERYRLEPSDSFSPERAFDRNWVQTVIQQVLLQLREEYQAGGRAELFDQLKDYQPGVPGAATYAELGARLAMSEGAVKVAAHRLRHRHRELLRAHLAQTVTTAAELEDEVRHLIDVMNG
jgi:RNA polymerase sigma-70 factor (ECF subfamily)